MSSKTTAHFLRQSHGFNGVHGRMPALATGANAECGLVYIGISGDLATRCRSASDNCATPSTQRELAYVLENNGVYGLTKGQFSASADVGSKSARRGQRPTADRSRVARIEPRRDVRRTELRATRRSSCRFSKRPFDITVSR
jgi:pyruvate/2-oxoacid:ferredoxin oxidoreductase beta subunit